MSSSLHFVERGEGSPVLMTHGFPLDHSMWRFQIEALSANYRVIAPDLRGLGQSPIEPIAGKTGIAMAEYADELASLLDQLNVDEPAVFIGFSMGGYIAWQFFRNHHNRLRALVQCDTKAVGDTPQTQETRFKMAESVEGWGSAHIASLMTPKLFASATLSSNNEIVQEVQSVISRTDPVGIAAAQRGMAHREDATPLLSNLDLPVLYLVGEEDQISTPEEMQAMADQTPGAQLVKIAEAGHMSPLENPQAVSSAILKFLARL